MPRARAAVVTASLLLAVVPVAVGAGASTAVAGTETQVSVNERPTRAVYHDEIGGDAPDVVRHRGGLSTAGGDPLPGATVTLERRLAGGTWSALDDKTTDEQGRYAFYSYVAGNARYRVSFAGDPVNDPSTSGTVRLKAMRDFNAEVVEKKQHAVLKGNINPGWGNKVVRWQKRTCATCRWRTIDKARAGKHGAWRFTGGYPPLGERWYFRATLDGTDDFVRSWSSTLVTRTTKVQQRGVRVSGRQ